MEFGWLFWGGNGNEFIFILVIELVWWKINCKYWNYLNIMIEYCKLNMTFIK